ncbi:MAG TPA: FimV/HubP family polar landmark protein [Steroidobacteraceae bacterium]|nr:FimV/HubP family polar landmark protein [Steroidobacteraceae bacterium]
MFAKRSSRALALLLALPSAAFAVGLGDIHLLSPLNAPLNAEIEVTDVAPDEVNTLQVSLAPRDTFAAQGLDYPTYLTSVQVKAVRTPDGREVVKLSSTDPMTEPFVTLLIQVTWSHGQLVREYTMLLDPPLYTPGQSAAASAAVAAPSTGAGTRAGEIARSSEAPAPTPTAPAAAPAAAAPAPAETAASAPSEAPPPAPSPASASPAPAAAAAGGTHVVERGETLSGIASGIADQKVSAARTEAWMLAIYQANPRAFDNNMNVLRAGTVLRIPEAERVTGVSPSAAAAEIHRQYAAWRNGAAAPTAEGAAPEGAAAPAQPQPGHLRLVPPSQSASVGAAPGAQSAEVGQLQGRVHELESQLAESNRLLELKNADLARLQAQLAAKQGGQAATQPPAAQAPPPVATQPSPAPATNPPVAAEKPAPVVTPAPPPAAAAAPPESHPTPVTKPLARRKPAPAAPAAGGGSMLDTIMSFWWLLVLAALVLLAVVALRFVRSRRASEFDSSLGRLAVAGATAADAGRGLAAERFDSGEVQELDVPAMRAPAPHPEPEFTVEETGSHERPRFAAAPGASPAPPKHVTADDTISSETAINLDQGDPLAEADFHMAYGLYDQAADLIRIAISREPARRDLKLKLLEVFFVWGNKEQFLQTAHELAGSRANAAPGEWEKILIMGKQLAPEDELFSSGAAVTGAAAAGVDLNLEGGQSRVDFDLLGEPSPAEGPQGVDLDIGAAVGEHGGGATESTTNVTDRNIALEASGIRTGSTRQMTANLRQPTGMGGGEAEGPTVEQPALVRPDNPTIRKKVETALKQSGGEQTQELALDDLGLDLGAADTVDQPSLASANEGPTLVANLDDQTRKSLEDTHTSTHVKTVTTGQWSFDPAELESAVTQAGPVGGGDGTQTSRLQALREGHVDVDLSGEDTGTHAANGGDLDVDLSGTGSTGTHAAANGEGLDLDVGTATVPDTAFAATQRLQSEDLALPDLEPVTMSEVGTKLDLARAYMDMGDPEGARNILEEVLNEGSAAQKQEAQRLMESLPG